MPRDACHMPIVGHYAPELANPSQRAASLGLPVKLPPQLLTFNPGGHP
jgi:hypothetical protein